MMRLSAYIIPILACLLSWSIRAQAQQPMAHSIGDMEQWGRYPSYPTYVAMMEHLADTYSDMVSLVDIGRSAGGRRILALRITQPGDTSLRPRVLLSSTIHGDEVTGFLFTLRLADSIIRAEASDTVSDAISASEVLYIAPLLNPDGTYGSCDTSIIGPSRYNANGVDLNRNFPTPEERQGYIAEPETEAVIRFAASRRFAFSVSIHCGDEVVNYPWDSYTEAERKLPDLRWWQDISQEYVDAVRSIDSNRLLTVNHEGHVFGSNWYKVTGGMQDWMLETTRCRETTIELANIKVANPQQAQIYWNACRGALTRFLRYGAVGFKGRVTDMLGNPLPYATISIRDHDDPTSEVITNGEGIYFRPTMPGQLLEVCASDLWHEEECKTISTPDQGMAEADFMLRELMLSSSRASDLMPSDATVSADAGRIRIQSQTPMESIRIMDMAGHIVSETRPNLCMAEYGTHNFSPGVYVVTIKTANLKKSHKIAILK